MINCGGHMTAKHLNHLQWSISISRSNTASYLTYVPLILVIYCYAISVTHRQPHSYVAYDHLPRHIPSNMNTRYRFKSRVPLSTPTASRRIPDKRRCSPFPRTTKYHDKCMKMPEMRLVNQFARRLPSGGIVMTPGLYILLHRTSELLVKASRPLIPRLARTVRCSARGRPLQGKGSRQLRSARYQRSVPVVSKPLRGETSLVIIGSVPGL